MGGTVCESLSHRFGLEVNKEEEEEEEEEDGTVDPGREQIPKVLRF